MKRFRGEGISGARSTWSAPAVSSALAEIDKRETDVREQLKASKLPAPVFKSRIAEFTKEREALNRRAAPKARQLRPG